MNNAIRHRDAAFGLGGSRMSASEPNTTARYKTFDALAFIALLVGVEQLVAAWFHAPYSSFGVGASLLALGPFLFYLTGGWDRISAKLANLPRLKFVRPK